MSKNITRDRASSIAGMLPDINSELGQKIMSEIKIIVRMNVMLQVIKSEVKHTESQVGPDVEPTFALSLYTIIQQYFELATKQIGHKLDDLDLSTGKDVTPILNEAIDQVYKPYLEVSMEPMTYFPGHVKKSFLRDFDSKLAKKKLESNEVKEMLEKVITCFLDYGGSKVEGNHNSEANDPSKPRMKNDGTPGSADQEAKGTKLEDGDFFNDEGIKVERIGSIMNSSEGNLIGNIFDTSQSTFQDLEISFKDGPKDVDADSCVSSLSTDADLKTVVQASVKKVDWKKLVQTEMNLKSSKKAVQVGKIVTILTSIINESFCLYEQLLFPSAMMLMFLEREFVEAAMKIAETHRCVYQLNQKIKLLLHRQSEKYDELQKESKRNFEMASEKIWNSLREWNLHH